MKQRVLIVDDSATVRTHILSGLTADYECIVAIDGEKGLAAARTEQPAVVIADIEMPGMDGLELLEALKADPTTKAIPVIIVTTVTGVDRMNECRAAGCAGFVLKPVEIEYLKAKIRSLISKSTGGLRR